MNKPFKIKCGYFKFKIKMMKKNSHAASILLICMNPTLNFCNNITEKQCESELIYHIKRNFFIYYLLST